MGRRRLIGGIAVLVGLAVYAAVVATLGVEWGLVLLAAGLGIVVLGVVKLYLDLRALVRQSAGTERRLETGFDALQDTLRESGTAATVVEVEGVAQARLEASLLWFAARRLGDGGLRASIDDEVALLRADDWFDRDWYAQEVGHRVSDPVEHYVRWGAMLGLDPHPWFPTTRYLEREPDSLARWRTPLAHFIETGRVASADSGFGPRDEADLKLEYLERRLDQVPDTFVLYRIVGNDLPPRHRVGQSVENLRFILEHEAALPGCEKRWVVNRIVDAAAEEEVIGLLEEHGFGYLHIPFDLNEYRHIGWRLTDFDPPGLTYRREFEMLHPGLQLRAVDHVYHDKNLYVMNNNGARNAALDDGRGRAKWVLPWDGNCFLTPDAWSELVDAVTRRPYLKYFTVPMARVVDHDVLFEPDLIVEATEEPQLAFRRDAEERFDPDVRYGHRPKVELFYRLGVPGPWDEWWQVPWDPPRPRPVGAGPIGQAGWVARLFSGEQAAEEDISERGVRRVQAIVSIIDRLDERIARATFSAASLFALDEAVLEAQRERYRSGDPDVHGVVAHLVDAAAGTLDGPAYSVTSKTGRAPSGNPHDYFHPSPYWWPNPNRRDGRPYVKRDGQRAPGTRLFEAGSERYDRSALQAMIDETFVVALAGWFTGEERFIERGVRLLETWFLDKRTRMTPHLRYAQVQGDASSSEGTHWGIIEASDFYYLLDAVRLVERTGGLTDNEAQRLRTWFADYRDWLEHSEQGKGERAALNNHGVWYDVQVASIDAYLDDVKGVLYTMRRAQERVGQHFEPDGRQPHELARTLTQHYCTYNLQAWVTLAAFAQRVGQDLWGHATPDGRALSRAVGWVADHIGRVWPYEQLDEFDPDRMLVLAHLAAPFVPSIEAEIPEPARNPWTLKQVFTPYDGIRPYWALGSVVKDAAARHSAP